MGIRCWRTHAGLFIALLAMAICLVATAVPIAAGAGLSAPAGLGGPSGVSFVDAGHGRVNVARAADAGSIAGRWTLNGRGVNDMQIFVDDAEGNWVTQTFTAADGTYTLTGLAAGDYALCFNDDNTIPSIQHWYNGKTTRETADPVTVAAGQTTSGINYAQFTAPPGWRKQVTPSRDYNLLGVSFVDAATAGRSARSTTPTATRAWPWAPSTEA